MGTSGSVSCCFICVHGCQTAARLRASQRSLTDVMNQAGGRTITTGERTIAMALYGRGRARRTMTTPSTVAEPRYTATAIALHWLIAALIVGGITLGLSMVDLPLSRQKLQWYAWHKWIGITVFLLTCLRLAWRATHAVPRPLETMPPWQR